jgi:hypothetical protein
MAKREDRDLGYPANADRAVRRSVRRLVKVERRLERARRELDDAAADLENLQGQLRALRVAMMAGAAEAVEAPPVGEAPGAVAPEPAEEQAVPNGEAEPGPEGLGEGADLEETAEEPETEVAASWPSGVAAGPESGPSAERSMAPDVAGSAESLAEMEARIEVEMGVAADAVASAEQAMPAEVPADVPAEVAVADVVAVETWSPEPPAPPELEASLAAPAGEVLDAGPTPWADEAVAVTSEPPAAPEPAAGPAPDDTRWPLPEEATTPDAGPGPGSSSAEAATAAETDADASVSDLAEQTPPQRRMFRGWPFIDPERRW